MMSHSDPLPSMKKGAYAVTLVVLIDNYPRRMTGIGRRTVRTAMPLLKQVIHSS